MFQTGRSAAAAEFAAASNNAQTVLCYCARQFISFHLIISASVSLPHLLLSKLGPAGGHGGAGFPSQKSIQV
eukprot:COSAG03_NODE_1772_length_3544_cov_800.559071_6_plen_72_part_00